MSVIVVTTRIHAPIATVFDLSRSIDLHVQSTAHTNERAVAGRTEGLIELGESVTWEATHFFVRQRLTSKIVEFDRPTHFRDTMIDGAFQRFDHDHDFAEDGQDTIKTDTFDYTAPFGLLGSVAERLILNRYLRNLLVNRNQFIKQAAESGATQGASTVR